MAAIKEGAVDTAVRKQDKLEGAQSTGAVRLRLTINGVAQELSVQPWTTLLDLLRDHLQLKGTKKGCDHGQCGACTVLIDDRRYNSCLLLAVMQDGASITTIEGLASEDSLHPVQQAFIDHDAFQCGYCTPGQICSAVGLIAEGRAGTKDEIRELMSGNLCRCGAYVNIVAAVEQAIWAIKQVAPNVSQSRSRRWRDELRLRARRIGGRSGDGTGCRPQTPR